MTGDSPTVGDENIKQANGNNSATTNERSVGSRPRGPGPQHGLGDVPPWAGHTAPVHLMETVGMGRKDFKKIPAESDYNRAEFYFQRVNLINLETSLVKHLFQTVWINEVLLLITFSSMSCGTWIVHSARPCTSVCQSVRTGVPSTIKRNNQTSLYICIYMHIFFSVSQHFAFF